VFTNSFSSIKITHKGELMKDSTIVHVPTAPRLRPRRLVRAYFFPWSQPVVTSALAAMLWLIDVPLFAVLLWWSITFICFILQDLSLPQSRLTWLFYWSAAKINLKSKYRSDLETAHQVYTVYPDPLLFEYRHQLRWRLSTIVVLLTWLFTAYQSTTSVAVNELSAQVLLTVLLFGYGLIPYGELVADRMRHATPAWRYLFWAVLGITGAALGFFSFYHLRLHWFLSLTATGIIVLLYTAIFLIHRFSAGERALNEVIRTISFQLLTSHQVSQSLDTIPDLIHKRLRHDRVFILEMASKQELVIIGQAGDYPSVLGSKVPMTRSITGKAFQDRVSVIWNDVRVCPYYRRVHPNDDTQSEIAVPIIHQGVVFGVLDVQSCRQNVYGPADVTALETIARILGAAIAAEKQDAFYTEAVQLWERVLEATGVTLSSEKEVFDLFATFAQEELEADLVIYFPLSLSGYPVRMPYIKGEINRHDLLRPPKTGTNSSLIQLIQRWKPYYEPEVTSDSLLAQSAAPETPEFVNHEEIKSTCFIPVGMQQERLGALFLNFRQRKSFNKMFQFIVLSLAQSLAKATAQVRYRNIVFRSFGRPEFAVHNIANRYGLKGNVLRKASILWHQGDGNCCSEITNCIFTPLFQDMEHFVQEILLVESSIPPDFWQESLKNQLDGYRSMRPKRSSGQRSRLRLNIAPAIERESPWVKLALYRVITEAVNNAILHGDALHITVDVLRQSHTIEVKVVNDGKPLPETAHKKRSSAGIYSLLKALERDLGAKTDIGRKPDGQGTCVIISLPALPMGVLHFS
jgi:putative methionine-R-sulfoxide reductase with GAF domain